MSNSLYALARDFKDKVIQLEEMELDQETINDTLDSLTFSIEEKVENIVKYMRSLETLAEAKKAEAKRLNESAASDLKKAEFFKNYITNNLQAVGIKDLQAGVFKINFQKGREVVEIDESKLPESFWVVQDPVIKPMDKNSLKRFLKEGREIPGVTIVRNPDTLQIK